jgi:hypothetical protein
MANIGVRPVGSEIDLVEVYYLGQETEREFFVLKSLCRTHESDIRPMARHARFQLGWIGTAVLGV